MKKAGRVILKVLSVMILLAFTSGLSFATEWGLVYENDKDGDACNSTSLSTLVTAVKAGADIKVVTYSCSNDCASPAEPFVSRKLEVVMVDTDTSQFVEGKFHIFNEAVVNEIDDLVHKKVTIDTRGDIFTYWGVNDNLPSSPYNEEACIKWFAN